MSEPNPTTTLGDGNLVTIVEPWTLWPERCPCDVDLVNLAHIQHWTGRSILHMGTGDHHVVGQSLCDPGLLTLPNWVLGVTCTPAEVTSYMDLATANPKLSRYYKVLFGDIYLLERELLPKFDVITLFHLCERPDPRRQSYEATTPSRLLWKLNACLKPGGTVIGYSGSAAWEEAGYVLERHFSHDSKSSYRSLEVFRA